MSPQLAYALRKVLIQLVLSALGIFAANQADLLNAGGLDPLVWGGIITAVIAAATRTVEGIRDGQRASGDTVIMQKSDVGFEQVLTKAEVDTNAHLVASVDGQDPHKLEVHVVRSSPVVVDPFVTNGASFGEADDGFPESKTKTLTTL